jgi:serine/threonine protein kinase
VEKHYKLGKVLGSGNFADVHEATLTEKGREWVDSSEKKNPIPEKVAVKVIDKSKVEDMNDIKREIEIMQMVSHPNIIQLYELFREDKKVSLVMELVTGGELFDRIVEKSTYTEKEAASTLYVLCDALDHLHKRKIVHRDLKPENLLYSAPGDEGVLKVADFGLARLAKEGDVMKTACGTPGYVAPEILMNKGYDSPAVDMWSVGVILYILLCGFPPFYEEELPALFDSILKARYDFPSPWWDGIDSAAKGLVKKLLELDEKKRLTAEQVMTEGWIQTAADTQLLGAKKQLKKYNASRKLRKAALGIIAQQRMERAMQALRVKQQAADASTAPADV